MFLAGEFSAGNIARFDAAGRECYPAPSSADVGRQSAIDACSSRNTLLLTETVRTAAAPPVPCLLQKKLDWHEARAKGLGLRRFGELVQDGERLGLELGGGATVQLVRQGGHHGLLQALPLPDRVRVPRVFVAKPVKP